ncbi:MAG: hypothetical protein WBC59_04015 [Phycisphaerae bacterium]
MNREKRWLSAMMVLTWLLLFGATGQAAEASDESDELAKARTEIRALKSLLKTSALQELQARNEVLEVEIRELTAKVEKLQKELSRLESLLDSTTTSEPQKTIEELQKARQEINEEEPAPRRLWSQLGKWDGFRGIRWGTELKTLNGMTIVEEDGKLKYCTREGEKLSIGKAQLESIYYMFYTDLQNIDRLIGVGVETVPNRSDSEALKRTVVERFGEGAQQNEFVEVWVWRGQTTGGDKVRMGLEQNPITDQGVWVLWYEPLERQREMDKKRAAEEGAKSDF